MSPTRPDSPGAPPPWGSAAKSTALLAGLSAAVLIALCAAVWGMLLEAQFSNDDELLIVNNLFIRDFAHFWDNVTRDYFYNSQGSSIGYWRPLTKVTYMLGWSLGGAEPAGYYAVNVVLFTLVILLGALVIWRSGSPGIVAFGAAALAAVHPAHAESVGIVTSRSDLLVAMFLLALLAVELHPRRAPWRRALGLTCAALALLSKEVGVIAPVLVGIVHLAVRRESWRGALRRALPYLLLVALYAVVRLKLGITPQAGVHRDVDTATMVLATGKTAGIYALRLALPFLVEPIVGPAVFPAGPDLATLGWCGLALAVALLLLALTRRRTLWPALALVCLPLAPALSLRYVTISVHADRLPVFDRGLILPSLGVAWLLMVGLFALATALERRGRSAGWLLVPAAGWALVFAVGAFDNVRDAQTPASRAAALVEAVKDVPVEELPLFQRHVVLEERGIELAQSGDLAGAEQVFEELIELDPTNAAARANLAKLYRFTGRPQLAIEQLRWILEYQGTTRTARDRRAVWVELAQACAEAGNEAAAQQAWAEAQKLAPEGAVPGGPDATQAPAASPRPGSGARGARRGMGRDRTEGGGVR